MKAKFSRIVLWSLAAAMALPARAATLTVSGASSGTTPDQTGYNLAHFMEGSNAADWFRYSGVKAARIFISPSDIEPTDDISPVGDGVSDQSSFFARRAALRANAASKTATLSSTYVKWSTFTSHYSDLSAGSNNLKPSYALAQLKAMGVDVLANITASDGRFPIASDADWAGKWELWQHFYAQAFLLSRDYAVTRFSMFNEPNNWAGMTEPAWLVRFRLCTDAIQCAVADMNNRYSKSVVARVYAPNTANGESKYNTASDTWGTDAVSSRHLLLDGTTSAAWNNLHAYNYQKYSMLTNDGGGLTGYIEDIDKLRGYLTADMAPENPLPLGLTEFNVRTGSSYDALTSTLDDPSDFVALAANCIALTQHDARFLYLFKFGQTDYAASNYGVTKNGTHYVDNDSAGTNNYGGATKGAEVFRLFAKASQGARPWYAVSGSSGATPTSTAGVWSMATQDASAGMTYVYIANKNASTVSLDVDLSALGIPEGNPVVVEEVSTKFSGAVARVTTVTGGKVPAATMPAQSVWLVSVPTQAAALSSIDAAADTQLSDGVFASTAGTASAAMLVRDDGTVNGRRVTLLKVAAPSASGLRQVLLDLSAATASGSAVIQAHVYGVSNDAWSEGTATWAAMGSILRQGMEAGDDIPHNVVAGQGSTTQLLGQITAESTLFSERMLDVTDFVRAQSDGFASFLIVQEHRWDVAQPSLNLGDVQTAGLALASRDNNATGARLLVAASGSPAGAPAILSRPQSRAVNSGTSVTFSVVAASTTAMTYQWRKDGVAIGGATSSSYTTTVAGTYSVAVTNAAGTTTSSGAVLTVNTAPSITSAPANQSVNVGDPVSFTVVASGSPEPTYQWSKGGTDIAGAVGATYSFVTSSLNDAGTYSVTVSNVAGSASASASLGVSPASGAGLSITSTAYVYSQDFYDALAKSHTTSVSGSSFNAWADNAILGWYATTDAAPFQGYRTLNYGSSGEFGSHPLAAQAGLLSMGSASSDKERALGGLAWADNNVYFGVKLTNKTGATLDGCRLRFDVEQYSATTAALNASSVTLSSRAGGTDLKSGTWTSWATAAAKVTKSSYNQLDGNKSTNRSSVSVTLTGLNLAPNQDLWLRWTVSTTSTDPVALGLDDLTVDTFKALVLTAPVFSLQPQSQQAEVGDPVTLSAAASGTPSPTFQWRKDGADISGATGTSLTIASASLADSGSYTVVATNSSAAVSSDPAVLTVGSPPVLLLSPISQTVTEGASVTFLCGASGSPAPTYQWSKNGIEILGATSASYTIAHVTASDAGAYSVTANNFADSAASAPAILTVNPPPYSQWKSAQFGANASNPAIAGDLADPDADGMVNLLEYGLGRLPLNPDGPALTPVLEGGSVVLYYNRSPAASDLAFRVLRAPAPGANAAWTTTGVSETKVSADPASGLWRAATPRDSGSIFLRLEVSYTAP